MAKIVDPHHAKSDGYRRVLKQIVEEGKCPFCPDNFRYHLNPILKKIGSWFVTENSWPYQNTKHHLLLIGEQHKEKFEQLQARDWTDITKLVGWSVKKYKIKGAGVALRFGATEYTGATVCHLHFHLIVPKDPETGRVMTVNFPIG